MFISVVREDFDIDFFNHFYKGFIVKTNSFVQLMQNLRAYTAVLPVVGTAQTGRTKSKHAFPASINLINSPTAFSESELSNEFSPLMHQNPISNTIRGLSPGLTGASAA